MPKITLLTTGDGSITLHNEELNESYHSSHGALTESKHVFIQMGLSHILERKKKIKLLEVGFGTGLNTALTLDDIANRSDCSVSYVGLEPFPVSIELVKELGYTDLLQETGKQYFRSLHEIEWRKEHELLSNFSFRKEKCQLEDFKGEKDSFDLIYFDAFAPRKQPEIWSLGNFEKLFALTAPDGMLVTYCAMGQFRRDLKAAGYEIEKLPGPPGKREMTRAVKPIV